MEVIQLEFNLDNKSSQEIFVMQQQIDQMCESMGKVRKKLFGELGELKKLYQEILKENEELKLIVKQLKDEKAEWVYAKGEDLFILS